MYHYTECGLGNVWLENGYTVHDTPYGRGVSVQAAQRLHEALAVAIVGKAGPVTGAELRFLRSMLDLSQGALGSALGVSEQTVSLWERRNSITKPCEAVVRMLVAEKLDGNPLIADLLEKIAQLDPQGADRRLVARESKAKGWTARVKPGDVTGAETAGATAA